MPTPTPQFTSEEYAPLKTESAPLLAMNAKLKEQSEALLAKVDALISKVDNLLKSMRQLQPENDSHASSGRNATPAPGRSDDTEEQDGSEGHHPQTVPQTSTIQPIYWANPT